MVNLINLTTPGAMPLQWNDKIFGTDEGNFTERALDTFRLQYAENPVYKAYADAVGTDPARVNNLEQIPFLPIRFFKTHEVKTGDFVPAAIFESSGTTGMASSRHIVKDTDLYEASFQRAFELFYGPVHNWCIMGLLPSYLEKGNSSLVYMVKRLIDASGHPASGFYLHEYRELADVLRTLENNHQPVLLIGVTYALLDLAEKFPMPLRYTVIMETGGMKGRRREMIRQEVHERLQQAFGIQQIHSEYGMTELLSQAYSSGSGLFRCPPWMKVLLREDEDPLLVKRSGQGIINVIDLANIHSCSFIATDDAGYVSGDGHFEVLGRVDNSDIRGCSLLMA